MDYAGAVLISTAILMLCGRVVVALLQRHAITSALHVHHPRASPSQRWPFPRLGSLDKRLRIGAVLGLLTVATGLLPAAAQSYVGWESSVGKAAGVAARWACLAGVIGTLRTVAQRRARR